MKNLLLVIVGWFVLGVAAQAASFDCVKASTRVEHIICDTPDISKLDDELAKAHKAQLQDQTKAEAVIRAQKEWLKERNGCTDADCVKQAYETRLLSLTHVSLNDVVVGKQNANGIAENERQYHFQITKGAGIPVCNAYLERLNSTEYSQPPYCGRPENDAIKGFAKLNRVPLSPREVRDLYPIVETFMELANQKNLDWTDMKLQQQLTETGQDKLSDAGVKSLQMDLDAGWAKMWRYDPPIDIDNDNTPDNVEIWHGSALPTGVGGRRCGEDGYPINHYGIPIRQPQVAIVVTGNNDRLDVARTEKIFGHPMGGYPIKFEGHWTVTGRFRPIGRSMGVFKYQDLYYFDTFFDSWGDIESKRRKNKQIGDTLAVFLHKDGKTKQVCEYLMTDNASQFERGAK